MVRRVALIAAGLTVLALILLLSGHWVLGIIFALPALAAIWAFLQSRSVR
jgi:hypothetical protein